MRFAGPLPVLHHEGQPLAADLRQSQIPERALEIGHDAQFPFLGGGLLVRENVHLIAQQRVGKAVLPSLQALTNLCGGLPVEFRFLLNAQAVASALVSKVAER
ncbi:hypothetical protein GGI1_16342 [Acidithiobacillus sp. GGI-221]|nr:hypothetical protein GGI1_16342 [Acidithiobacillus sp. GGI-221]